MTEQNLQT